MLDNPELPFRPQNCIRPVRWFAKPARCEFARAPHDQRPVNRAYATAVRALTAAYPEIRIVDLADSFCDASRCRGIDERGMILYMDSTHLNYTGSLTAAAAIMAAIRELQP